MKLGHNIVGAICTKELDTSSSKADIIFSMTERSTLISASR